MNGVTFDNPLKARPAMGLLVFMFVASMILPHIPLLNLVLTPITALTTIVHEMGHAVACLLTGGSVSSISIVPDGAGHGGLTFTRGGNPYIVDSAGYLGTTLFGCLLIALGRYPRLSKGVLMTMGLAFGAASLTFMGSTVLHGGILSGIASMLLGLALSAGFIYLSSRLSMLFANYVLLFIGVQLGLSALDSVFGLFFSSFGGGAWSDATNMASISGIPAAVWAFLWSLMSIGMLSLTIWWTYKADNNH